MESQLLEWLNTNYSLLIKGPRQVGKTFLLESFIHDHFASAASLSFHNNVPLIKAVLASRDQSDFLLRLGAFTASPIERGCCVFLDEIQEFYTYLTKHPEIDEYFDLLTAMKEITSISPTYW